MHQRLCTVKNGSQTGLERPTKPSSTHFYLNKAILKMSNLEALCAMLEIRNLEFNAVNVSTAWRAFHQLGDSCSLRDPGRDIGHRSVRDRALTILVDTTKHRAEEFDVRCCTMVLNVLAKLERKQQQLTTNVVNMLAVRLESIATTMNSQDIANVLWALARLEDKPRPALNAAIAHRAMEIHYTFKAQEIANFLWAHATSRIKPSSELLNRMSNRAVAVSTFFKPQEISNTLWAFATLKIKPARELLQLLVERATMLLRDIQNTREFKPQEISNIFWAFATLKITPASELVHLLIEQAKTLLQDSLYDSGFKPQEIAIFLYSFAAMRIPLSSDLFRLLSLRAEVTGLGFSAHGIDDLVELHDSIVFAAEHIVTANISLAFRTGG